MKEDKEVASASESAGKSESEDSFESAQESKEKNIFTEFPISGKRRHVVLTKKDEIVGKWLDENFCEEEGRRPTNADLYDQYVKMCIDNFIKDCATEHEVKKVAKTKFAKGFVPKDTSALKDVVKVMKFKVVAPAQKKDKPKVNMKEIMKEAFMDLKNPKEGVIFNRIRRYLMTHHPELRFDIRPNMLLHHLNSCNYVQLINGVKRLGRYRFWSEEIEEEDKKQHEEEKRIRKEKMLAKKEEKKQMGVESNEAKKDETVNGEGSSAEENKPDETTEKDKKATPKKKKKRAPRFDEDFEFKAPGKMASNEIHHGDPTCIEDTFPLAFTYMSEPKQIHFQKILQYMEKHYDENIDPETLLKDLEHGEKKGYWFKAKGSGKSAKFELTVETFDPQKDDDKIGQLINAMVSGHEPKTCSCGPIKDYIQEFHPKFNIASRPHLFKKAIERAIHKGLIIRLSGIGTSGRLQLAKQFTPSPTTLSGNDDEEVASNRDGTQGLDIKQFKDAYVPRATKRHGRTAAAGYDRNAGYKQALNKPQMGTSSSAKRTDRSASKRSKPAKGKAKVKSEMIDDDSESDDQMAQYRDAYKPMPSRSRGGSAVKPEKSKKTSATKRSRSAAVESEDEDEKPQKVKKNLKTPQTKTLGTKRRAQSPSKEDEEDEEIDESEDKKPKGRSSHSTPSKRAAASKRSRQSSDDESEEEVIPAKKSRTSTPGAGGKSAARKGPGKKESDEDTKSDEEVTPAKKSAPKKGVSKGSAKKEVSKEDESDEESNNDDEVEDVTPAKKSAPKKGVTKGSPKKGVSKKDESDEESKSDNDYDEEKDVTPVKKSAPKKGVTKGSPKKGVSKKDESDEESKSDNEVEDETPSKKSTPKGPPRKGLAKTSRNSETSPTVATKAAKKVLPGKSKKGKKKRGSY